MEPYLEDRMEKISEKYNLKYSKYAYKVVAEKDKTYFVTAYDGGINKLVYKGEEPEPGKAYITNQDNLENADFVEIDSKKFDIKGEFSGTNFLQLYDLKNSTNNLSLNNIGVYVSSEDYDGLDYDEIEYYSLQFHDNKAFQKFTEEYAQNATYFKDTEDYLQNFNDAISMNYQLAYIALLAYLFVTLVIFYITLKNMLDSMDKQFGLLKIVGITRKRMVFSMILIYLFVGLLAVVLGNVLGASNMGMMQGQFAQLYNFMYMKQIDFLKDRIAFSSILIAIILLLVGLMTFFKVSNRSLALIKSESLSKSSVLLRKTKKLMDRLPFLCSIKSAFALKKVSRILIVIIGVFLCGNFMAIGVGLYGEQLNQLNKLNDSTDFKNAYYFEDTEYESNKNAAYLEEAKLEYKKEIQAVELIGLYSDGNVFTKEVYNNIKRDKIIMSKNIARKNDIKVGDAVSVVVNNKKLNLEVGMILNSNYEYRCFVDINTLYEKCLEQNAFNVYYEKDGQEDMDDSIIDQAVRVETLKDYQGNNTNKFAQILMIVGVLLGFSILIVILVFALISSLNIHDSIGDIKILKLLGYKSRIIFHYTVLTYLLIIALTMLIGMVSFPWLCTQFESLLNVSNWQFYIGVSSRPMVYAASCMVIIVNYYLWMTLVYVKIKKGK
jgi:ABC-type lipoprotein release transport system permease subunit